MFYTLKKELELVFQQPPITGNMFKKYLKNRIEMCVAIATWRLVKMTIFDLLLIIYIFTMIFPLV